MMPDKKIYSNILLCFFSIIFFILFLEFVIFHFVLVATDMPALDFVNGIVQYKPDQEGVYRVKNEIAAHYRINDNGWNSAYDRYDLAKHPGKNRIAIIGDSYVEATEVDYNKSFAERIQEKLGKNEYEVYRFGISGAPLSQYLYMMRKEVVKYNPDFLIVVVVHNDFDESYKYLEGTYGSNFMKFDITNGRVQEKEPARLIKPWYSFIRGSATWRYLVFRQKLPYRYLKDMLLANDLEFQANISTAAVDWEDENKIATEYAFSEIKKICDAIHADMVIVMNGVMEVVYGKIPKEESRRNGALVLNDLARETAGRIGIDFIDLETVFEDDYHQNRKRLTFINDGHWNEYGHEIVARVASEYIRKKRENKLY